MPLINHFFAHLFSLKPLWTVSTYRMITIVCISNILVYHLPLLNYASQNLELASWNGVLTVFTVAVVIYWFSSLFFHCVLMVSRLLLKPLLMFFALGNAIALFFLNNYNVFLDKTMISNIMNTDSSEAGDFFGWRLLVYVLVFGVLPCFLILRTRINPSKRWRIFSSAALTFIFGLVWVYIASSTWLWVDKHSKYLGGRILPWAYVIGIADHQIKKHVKPKKAVELPAATFKKSDSNKKTVVVLVIGETARSKNFSLYGYERNTNPLLANANVAVLKNATACDTYTTMSINCMLAHNNARTNILTSYEPLPSYLHRHGVDVIWRSNNWGEPTIKTNSYLERGDLSQWCKGEECAYDGMLLANLSEQINASKSDKVFVVLHQKGSHGPLYNTRHPKRFTLYKPICTSVQLHLCSQQELVNAYDNTIVYTDHFLNNTINILKRLPNTQSTMLYLSDHGESLGEYNLYLHGTPLSIAPDVQKDIPFIVWMSDAFQKNKQINNTAVEQKPHHSHQSVFHSVMGAFDMHSDVYAAEKDIFNHAITQGD